ncbi:MAG TPA: acyltransferase [Stellaceae bacterium]|nr:acyltransferase [Stellaceae bacterium]
MDSGGHTTAQGEVAAGTVAKNRRENNFDALRLVAALAVILSHAFMIAQGTEANDPLNRLTGNQCPLGLTGVFVFFAVSGFLVTQSFEQTRSPLRYLAKRCLRIFPAYYVCLIATALVLGPIVTTLPLGDYFGSPEPWNYLYYNSFFDIRAHTLPGVLFVNNAVGLEVNGSLWSLGCEFDMYLMVLVLGMLRLLNLPVCLALLALGMACIAFPDALGFLGGWGWTLSFFAAGMVLYKLRDTRIFAISVFDGRIALLALAGLALSIPLRQFILLFPVFGCYLALYLALHAKLPLIRATRFGDLSYGLYIFGWPSEQIVIWLLRGQAAWWQVFLLASLLAGALAFLSWHLVEKRALHLKPRGPWQTHGKPGIMPRLWPVKSLSVATSPSNTGGPSD